MQFLGDLDASDGDNRKETTSHTAASSGAFKACDMDDLARMGDAISAATVATSSWWIRSGSDDCVTSDDNTTPFGGDAEVEEFLNDVFLFPLVDDDVENQEPAEQGKRKATISKDAEAAGKAAAPVKHKEVRLKLALKEIRPLTPPKRGKNSEQAGGNEQEEDGLKDAEGDPYLQLSPRSRRKRKNRDQMRQARQKEKDTMQKLRDTVERLEAKYQKALSRNESTPLSLPVDGEKATSFPYMTSYTQTTSALSTGTSSKYSELISTSSRLKEENFRLKQMIHEKHKLQETLERNFCDYIQSSPSSPSSLHDTIQQMSMTDFLDGYVPMTIEECWMRIRGTHDHMNSIHQSIMKHAASDFHPGQPDYFGWKIQHHVHGEVLLFVFEKPFHHISSFQAMERMWSNELAMQSYRSDAEAAKQTMRVVQHINEDTYIFQRRMLDPATNKYVKSTYMRFRLKTAKGYVIGLKTIDPAADSDEDGKAWASKACVWTEFIQECSPYGHDYCTVRMTGSTNLQSGTQRDHRVAADTIIGLLRWENKNIGPVFTLTGH